MLNRVVFEATSRCNLDCLHCYNVHKRPGSADWGTGDGYRRSRKTLARLFSQCDVELITMSGGEPLLAERFLELVLFCRMNHRRVSIITNGNAGRLDDYRALVDMGVHLFQLPLHSSHPDEHDRMTSRAGSWERSVASMNAISRLGAKVVPVVVITRINYRSIVDTLWLCRELGFDRIMLNRFNIGGRGIAHRSSLFVHREVLRRTFRQADDTASRLSLKLSSNVCTPTCVLDPDDYPHIGFSACNPQTTNRPIALDPAGNLRFCNHSPRTVGNIHRQALAKILDSAYVRTWRDARPLLCTGCKDWGRCFGGCRAASEQLGRTLYQPDPILEHGSDLGYDDSLGQCG